MAAGKKEMVENHSPKIERIKKDKLFFASNATPASLLLLSSSNASLCVVCGRLPDIHSESKKTPDANTSNRNKS